MTLEATYDLDRAARAGGFEHDLPTGREVARCLHTTLRDNPTTAFTSAHVDRIVEEVLDNICDLWEETPEANTLWLAAMHNAIIAMLRDLLAQRSQARAAQENDHV